MLTDLKLIKNDISFDNNDIQLINNDDCVKQDIISQLTSSFNTTFYDDLYGSGFLNFIHETMDDNVLDMMRQRVKIMIQDHPNINSNSIEVNILNQQPLTIEMIFSTTINKNQTTTLTYTLDTSF